MGTPVADHQSHHARPRHGSGDIGREEGGRWRGPRERDSPRGGHHDRSLFHHPSRDVFSQRKLPMGDILIDAAQLAWRRDDSPGEAACPRGRAPPLTEEEERAQLLKTQQELEARLAALPLDSDHLWINELDDDQIDYSVDPFAKEQQQEGQPAQSPETVSKIVQSRAQSPPSPRRGRGEVDGTTPVKPPAEASTPKSSPAAAGPEREERWARLRDPDRSQPASVPRRMRSAAPKPEYITRHVRVKLSEAMEAEIIPIRLPKPV